MIISKKRRLTVWIVLACISAAFAVMHAETAARKKARYYYMAGAEQQALGNETSAYEYFKKAWQIDPTYAEGASSFGSRRLYIGLDTLQSEVELDRSLSMMKDYIDKYPGDLYENLFYGYVAGQLDHDDEGIRVLERTYGHHPQSSNILFHLSDAYAHKGDWDKAIDAIERYESQAGRTSQVSTRKLSFMLVAGDTVRAIEEVRKLTAANPTDASFAILRGNLYDVVDMPDSALVQYLRAEQLDPESGAAKLSLAEHYNNTGDSVAYDRKMYEVLLTEDLDFDQKTDLVASYLQTLLRDKQDHRRGDYLFSVLQNQYPHEPRVLDLSARYNAAKGDFGVAREQIAYAIDRDPSNVSYWGQLMTYQAADELPDEALKTFDRAKKHIVPDEQLKLYYVSVAQLAERYDSAASMLRSMIFDIQPDLPIDSVLTIGSLRRDITGAELDRLSTYLVSLGDVYYLGKDTVPAFRMYENAINIDDSNSMAKNNYAYFLSIGGGDLDKALELSRQTLTGFDSDNPTFLDTYAWILYLKGEYDEALKYQEKALEGVEGAAIRSAELYEHYGDIKAALGDWNEAISAWKEAIGIREENNETSEPEYQQTLEKIKTNESKADSTVNSDDTEDKEVIETDSHGPIQEGNNNSKLSD